MRCRTKEMMQPCLMYQHVVSLVAFAAGLVKLAVEERRWRGSGRSRTGSEMGEERQ